MKGEARGGCEDPRHHIGQAGGVPESPVIDAEFWPKDAITTCRLHQSTLPEGEGNEQLASPLCHRCNPHQKSWPTELVTANSGELDRMTMERRR
jgi:hypothetical protein